jgi:C4-dicarboxylate transporter DctM subunit
MFNLLSQAMVTSADNFALLAIPAFMLLGSLMGNGGLAESLIKLAESFTRKITGGLGMAGVIATMFFAAISGSGPAIVAAIGSILIPALNKRNYPSDYSASLLASSSIIGVIIPPSIPLIMFGVVASTSVTKLFIGGVIPGIIMGIALMIVNYVICKKNGYGITDGDNEEENLSFLQSLVNVFKNIWQAKWALFIPILVLGGIYGGIFTPTESAVVGVVYALIVGLLITKGLNWKNIKESLIEASLLSATIMFLVGGSLTFGRLLTMEHISEMIANNLLEITDSSLLVMLMILIFLLISGMFIDTISNIILFTPIFLPVTIELGYDPVYFGVFMVICLAIGYLTPPVGVSLFVAQGVAKVSFESIIKQVIPFLIVLIILLLVFMLFPSIIMYLPNLI